MTHVNIFRSRVDGFPGRIFNRLDDPAELSKFQAVRDSGSDLFVELGSGSGTHILEQARRHPDAKLFGFEIRYKRSVRTIEKADGVENVFILRVHASRFPELFLEDTLSGIWINFPDPWERPARRKHRMLNATSLKKIHSRLKSSGFLSFKTDHLEYFESVLGQIYNDGLFEIKKVVRDLHNSLDQPEDNIITEFESLFKSQAEPVYYLLAQKT